MTSCPEVYSRRRAVRTRAMVTRTSTSRPEFGYTLNVRLVQSEIYEILHPIGIRHTRAGADGPGLRQCAAAAQCARRSGRASPLLPPADRRPASPLGVEN